MSFEAISLEEKHRKTVVSAAMPLFEGILISTLSTMMVGEKGIELSLGGATVIFFSFSTHNLSLPEAAGSITDIIALFMTLDNYKIIRFALKCYAFAFVKSYFFVYTIMGGMDCRRLYIVITVYFIYVINDLLLKTFTLKSVKRKIC